LFWPNPPVAVAPKAVAPPKPGELFPPKVLKPLDGVPNPEPAAVDVTANSSECEQGQGIWFLLSYLDLCNLPNESLQSFCFGMAASQ
jgi:hypothetical protein